MKSEVYGSELVRTSFFMTKTQREQLKQITEATGAPLAFQLRKALEQYLESQSQVEINITPGPTGTVQQLADVAVTSSAYPMFAPAVPFATVTCSADQVFELEAMADLMTQVQ